MAKIVGEYVSSLPPWAFDRTPKAVWAALAVSYAANRERDGAEPGPGEKAWLILLAEWETLYDQGIVPQKPPAYPFKGRKS